MYRAYKTKGGRIVNLSDDEVNIYRRKQGQDAFIEATEKDVLEYRFNIGLYPSHFTRVYFPFWKRELLHDGYGYVSHLMKKHAPYHEFVLDNENNGQQITILHNIPTTIEKHLKSSTGKKVAFTMYETDKWPERYIEALSKCDAVIVPSQWNKKALVKQGLKQPIFVAPYGIPDDEYPVIKRKKGEKFRFLMPRIMNARKGWEYAIEAFKIAFPEPEKENVELVMKSHTPFMDKRGNVNAQLVPYYDTKNVRWVYENTPREKLAQMYHDYECLVFPSKGEGWGLPVHEALLTAMPTIGVKDNGTDVFASPGYLQVKGKKSLAQYVPSPVYMDGKQLFPLSPEQEAKQFLNSGNWVYADIEELAKAMREVYENYDQWVDKAIKSSEIIRKKYSVESTMLNLKSIITNILCL